MWEMLPEELQSKIMRYKLNNEIENNRVILNSQIRNFYPSKEDWIYGAKDYHFGKVKNLPQRVDMWILKWEGIEGTNFNDMYEKKCIRDYKDYYRSFIQFHSWGGSGRPNYCVLCEDKPKKGKEHFETIRVRKYQVNMSECHYIFKVPCCNTKCKKIIQRKFGSNISTDNYARMLNDDWIYHFHYL
jgi:hypothetical protein